MLLGNPFSPRYARARRSATVRALDYCSMHVAITDRDQRLWSLTEGPVAEGEREAAGLSVGRSRAGWDGDALVMELDERTTPGHQRIAGRITVRPQVRSDLELALDAAGQHMWWPVAPRADVEVALASPNLRFRGLGYHDANAGQAPLETTFSGWNWSRARLGQSRSVVTYDIASKGESATATLVFDGEGRVSRPPSVRGRLETTRWGLRRAAVADAGSLPRVARSLEDGPFYARSLVATRVLGEEVLAMHEVLSGDRLRRAWVRGLLGFRMESRP